MKNFPRYQYKSRAGKKLRKVFVFPSFFFCFRKSPNDFGGRLKCKFFSSLAEREVFFLSRGYAVSEDRRILDCTRNPSLSLNGMKAWLTTTTHTLESAALHILIKLLGATLVSNGAKGRQCVGNLSLAHGKKLRYVIRFLIGLFHNKIQITWPSSALKFIT